MLGEIHWSNKPFFGSIIGMVLKFTELMSSDESTTFVSGAETWVTFVVPPLDNFLSLNRIINSHWLP